MKYHDQNVIKEIVEKISRLSTKQKAAIIKDMKILQAEAQYEVSCISQYTAPEDAKQRRDTLNYYDDMLEELK